MLKSLDEHTAKISNLLHQQINPRIHIFTNRSAE